MASIEKLTSNMENPLSQMANAASDLVEPKPKGIFAQFRNNKLVSGSKDFLESNSLVAKVVFILLVLLLFIFLLRLMVVALHTLFGPKKNPILIDGIINGKKSIVISQDPKMNGSKPILRSDNEDGGIEFTYSTWLMIEDDNFHSFKPGKIKHIFHKGSEGINSSDDAMTGMAYPNNSPGVYLHETENKLIIVMNTFEKIDERVEVPDIPIHKWINLIIRLENRNLDVYINGTIVVRHALQSVPKQNYGNVYVNQGGGFSGLISALRYYNRSITTTEIQDIVAAGPNMSSNQSLSIFPPYLSTRWFLGNN
tara:strand:- start:1099 stop:2028 length:930 start_codon:yes stop_codon:yes gene_type:complete